MGDIFDGVFEGYFNDTQPKSDRLLAVLEVAHQSQEIFIAVRVKHFNAHLVDARLAPVAFNRFESGTHQGQGDPAG